MRQGIGLGVGINRSNYAQGIFNAYSARVVADGGVVESGACVDAVSSLLQSASLLLIPSGYKGGKLYSEIPTNGNGDLTWTRGSDAFRTNASGLIQRVPWNLLSYSSVLSDSSYTIFQLNRTDSQTDPNGGTTGALFTATSATNAYISKQFSTIVGQSYTVFVYLKGTSNGSVSIRVDGASTAPVNNVNYTTSYQQFTYTFTADSTTSTFIIGGYNTWLGSEAIYVAFPQANIGTTAQTYLPTTDRLNFPRLSYMYGSCPSALLEPQRTNLVLRSEEFDNASWTKFNTSVTANTTTSPDGSSNADTMTGNGTTTQKGFFQSISIINGVTYTISIYAKKNTNNFLQIGGGDSFAITSFANFNLDTGVLGTIGATATATITNVGNGWHRCTMTASTIFGGSTSIAYRLINSSNSPSGESNTLSTSVFLYGAQLEAGAYPTTYIPTTSATATRVADSFSRNNIYTNGLISASGGTWFVELRGNVGYTRDANIPPLFISNNSAGDGAGADVLAIGNVGFASSRLYIFKRINGVYTQLAATTTDTVKIAIKWNGSTADVFINGTKQVSATTFTRTSMEFLNCSGGDVPKFIQQMALFPTPLSDTDCTTITTL